MDVPWRLGRSRSGARPPSSHRGREIHVPGLGECVEKERRLRSSVCGDPEQSDGALRAAALAGSTRRDAMSTFAFARRAFSRARKTEPQYGPVGPSGTAVVASWRE